MTQVSVYIAASLDGYTATADGGVEWVSEFEGGEFHTNTIEGFWSVVKRGINGGYHSVSAKYLQGYLNEYAWRYTHRDDSKSLFILALL